MNPIVLAIPVFIALMMIEYFVMRKKNKSVYRFHETLGNIFCGMGQLFVDAFFKIPLIALYAFVLSASKVLHLNLSSKLLHFALLFVVIDLIFYLNHRLCHSNKWLWAIHGVHHQSEDYNYSVGLRMPWWHKLVSFWTPLPLALMGYSIQDYIIVISLHAALQIWTHTQMLEKRIPIFELFFVTPSHHRVHHGKNKIYIDKNFAGILSVWDYLFKTYEPESEKVIYGVNRVESHTNPIAANFIQFFPKHFSRLSSIKLSTFEKQFITLSTLGLMAFLSYFLMSENSYTLLEKFHYLLFGVIGMGVLGHWVERGSGLSPLQHIGKRLGVVSFLLLMLALF